MNKIRHLLFLTLITALFIGCVQEQTTTPAPTSEPASSEPTGTAETAQPASPTDQLQFGLNYSVRVVHVVDGDTIDVIMPGGNEERVRILGVDTPEKKAGDNNPHEYEGIDDLNYLARWSGKATDYAEDKLKGETVKIELDQESGLRGYYRRLLAYVYVGEKDYGSLLLENGYARVYTGDFKKEGRYLEIEDQAITNKVGLWNYTQPAVRIVDVNYNAEGNDKLNLNGEYVIIQNTKSTSINLQYWTLEDEADHYYTFTDFSLKPNENVTVHTGSGSDNATDLFWGCEGAIWNRSRHSIPLQL